LTPGQGEREDVAALLGEEALLWGEECFMQEKRGKRILFFFRAREQEIKT